MIVAGGTSAVGQKVLEAIFGDQAVRTLATRAREDLIERVERLLRGEADRFDVLLDQVAPKAESFARLHAAVDAIRLARRTLVARTDLGFVPGVGLEEGLTAEYRWLSEIL